MNDANLAIQLEGVTYAYQPGGGPPEVEDVTLTVSADDYLGIVGPNGAGKTTLLKLMLGLLKPQRGSVRVFGQPPSTVRARIGYVPQHARLDATVPATVLEIVLAGRLSNSSWGMRYRVEDFDAARAALDSVGALVLSERRLSSLSGGQRQRVLIARALACEPRILILDEPTAGADVPLEQGLHEMLRKLNERLPIVVVSHDIAFVSAHVKHVACLNRHLVCHASGEISKQVIAELYHNHGKVRALEHDLSCPTKGRLRQG